MHLSNIYVFNCIVSKVIKVTLVDLMGLIKMEGIIVSFDFGCIEDLSKPLYKRTTND